MDNNKTLKERAINIKKIIQTMGLCSSSSTAADKTTSTPTSNPATSSPNGGTTTTTTTTTTAAEAPANVNPPPGITILDRSTAHLENNEDDGGALEVYLDEDDVKYQARAGEAAEPTKRRPSMIIPYDQDLPEQMKVNDVVCGRLLLLFF